MADLIPQTANRLRPQFDEKSVTLTLNLPHKLPPARVDEDRICQVLTNLIGNALQYTPAGGTVTVAVAIEAKNLKITVGDTGIGIAPEHLPYLFTRFYRVDKSRSRAGGGSGIGLTIAKLLIEAHSGKIWATSPGEGQGSEFGFTLPLIA
jgi:histidine kinase